MQIGIGFHERLYLIGEMLSGLKNKALMVALFDAGDDRFHEVHQ